MHARRFVEGSGETFAKDPAVAGRHAATNDIRFEQDDVDSGRDKRQRTGGAGQSATDNRDACRLLTAKAGIRGAAAAGKPAHPERRLTHVQGILSAVGAACIGTPLEPLIVPALSRRRYLGDDMPLTDHLDRLARFEPVPYPVVSLYLNTQSNERGRDQFQTFVKQEFKARSRTYPQG
jgi:hypothetical protein